ncbi:DUF7109 family protein [Halocatena pleomorpha]|uniref:Uncharacterized protein n=1 Tax=Halocatena pleomorpha TaxID=1785090 RepID=A0A3P3RBN5_9EURY|nr:hypothetical protein [Halocatena pleomorpha]RRJ30881.1 hypothetical protein EIK79_08665 [Halocatena pleomorpha]
MTLECSADELAGIVDLFGVLTRDELDDALAELAFRRGEDPPDRAIIDSAVASYHLVEYNRGLAVGPTAFPTIPTGATDLPHIMSIEARSIDRERLARSVEKRFRGETARAVDAAAERQIAHLRDVSYDLETWGAVDLTRVRDRLPDSDPIESRV